MCHLTLFKGHEDGHSTNTRVMWMNYVPQLLEMINELYENLEAIICNFVQFHHFKHRFGHSFEQ